MASLRARRRRWAGASSTCTCAPSRTRSRAARARSTAPSPPLAARSCRVPRRGVQMTVKQELKQLADDLPEDVTWDDVLYEIYVQKKIASGLDDMRAGRTVALEAVRKRYGLGG